MIELNGVANIKVLLDELSNNLPNDDKLLVPVAKLYRELEMLNRYMTAIGTETQKVKDSITIPFWHEVKANPAKYPTLHEKVYGPVKKG